jgi:hypothetical protein
MTIDFAALAAPFSPIAVSWRIGATTSDKTKGMALAYLDARDVMDRLDEVCTPGGWQATYPHALQKTVCSIGILCGDHWVWKSNGAGDTDIEQEKGALSDAFKRAAVLWGIGRYLYNIQSPWVEIETRGRTSVIKDHEYARLATILQKHADGEVTRPTLPPAESDITEAARRWVSDQKAFLSTVVNAEDLKKWHATNKRGLDKLAKENQPLHGDLKLAYKTAYERTNGGAQLQ